MATEVITSSRVLSYSLVDHDVAVKPSSDKKIVFEIFFHIDSSKSSAVYKIPLACTEEHNVKVKVFFSEASTKVEQEQTHKIASTPKLEITNNHLKHAGDIFSVTWKPDTNKGDCYLIVDSAIPLSNKCANSSVENKAHYRIKIKPELYTKIDIRGFIYSKLIRDAKIIEILKDYLHINSY